MIESIQFTNFKVLRDTTLPLGPFTLLVGPNGSGKSTALSFLALIQRGGNISFDQVASADVKSKRQAPVEIAIKLTNPFRRLTLTFRVQPNQTVHISSSLWSDINGNTLGSAGAAEPEWNMLRRARIYSLDPRFLPMAVRLRNNQELVADSPSLAGVLDRLRDSAPERFELLNLEVGRLLPEFDRILFETPGEGDRSFLLRTREGQHQIPAADLSQGTLLALAILTLAYLPDPPPLIALEEPDRGIHPRLLRQLRDALYRLAYPKDFGEDRPPVQVIATTQSPYFLDLFSDHPEEIVIAEKVGLEAKFKRVMDHPHMDKILDGSAPLGEIWYSGILGGVPTGS